MIGIGHARTENEMYVHMLYELEPHPPFAVVRTSRPFRFFDGRRPDVQVCVVHARARKCVRGHNACVDTMRCARTSATRTAVYLCEYVCCLNPCMYRQRRLHAVLDARRTKRGCQETLIRWVVLPCLPSKYGCRPQLATLASVLIPKRMAKHIVT